MSQPATRRRGREDRGGPRAGRGVRLLLRPARAGGLLGMLAAGLALRLVTTSSAFALAPVDLPAVHWTNGEALAAAVALEPDTNAFEVDPAAIAGRIAALPAVASAQVSVGLPDQLRVAIVERQPILGWRVGDTIYLADRDGILFAAVNAATASTAGVPIVTDRRYASATVLGVGVSLDPVDIDVATRLASLVPADIGSAGTRLSLEVDDGDGYVLTAAGQHWSAIFGTYSQTLRTPDLIPGQVQLLRSLLFGREATLDRITLADDRNGTYTLRSSPKP